MIHLLLAQSYGLASPIISEVPLGMVNQNLAVQSGGQAYILKRYGSSGYNPDRVAWTWMVQRRLSEEGIPVAEVVPNRDGELVTRSDDGFYVLMKKVPGRHFGRGEAPERAAQAMGEALGRLHLALASEPVTEGYADLQTPDQAIARFQRSLAAAEAGATETDRIAAEILRGKIGATARLAPFYDEVERLPVQWVHGDYQETNVLFDAEDRVCAILDFDNLRVRPRGYDLMRAIGLGFDRFNEKAQAVFRGYVQTVRPEVEEVSMYALLWAYVGTTRSWPITARYEQPESYQPRWDRFIQPQSDYWEAEREQIREVMLRIASA